MTELRGKPIAVVRLKPFPPRNCRKLRSQSLWGKDGIQIYEAKRLCPGLVCVFARHECYVDFHHRLIEEIQRDVPVTAGCFIDEVACRLMDNEISV